MGHLAVQTLSWLTLIAAGTAGVWTGIRLASWLTNR